MKEKPSTESKNLNKPSANRNVSDGAPNEPTDIGKGPVSYGGPELNGKNDAELPRETPLLESHFESHSLETERPDSIRLVKDKTNLSSPAGRATGPRTPAGKKRSKHNALKFGIFSKVVLLKNEKRSELQSLLIGLRNDFRPEGMFETIQVDMFATLYWRFRRFMIAEMAEIEKATSFLEWDEKERHEEEARETFPDPLNFDAEDAGLICKIANPKLLQRCLDLLKHSKRTWRRGASIPRATNKFWPSSTADLIILRRLRSSHIKSGITQRIVLMRSVRRMGTQL